MTTNNKNKGFVYLKNGFDLFLPADNNLFSESIKYSGFGGSTNNYLLSQYNYGRSLGDLKELFKLEKNVFQTRVSSLKNSFDSIQSIFKNIDTTLLNLVTTQHQNFYTFLEKNYDLQHTKGIQEELFREKLSKGKRSPKFNNYVNYKGGTTSLDSFKGKYVYIDVWATWCRPCLAQIPALKQLEEKYHGKNIQFVSISIDNPRTAGSWDKAATKWKNMVNSKNLTGVQLFAGQDLQFAEDYQISSIPRFILIDPNGNIVEANAPRPSDPQLVAIFNGLGI
ncbi:MAG: TlpA family protein disulfide reductase [Flavobacteriaceae bacterium]|nr:TlpA family protein disulfide reductase [Flavobacteriaceae bacterium]